MFIASSVIVASCKIHHFTSVTCIPSELNLDSFETFSSHVLTEANLGIWDMFEQQFIWLYVIYYILMVKLTMNIMLVYHV